MICDDDTLEQITKRVRPHAQRKVLESAGIVYKIRPDGSLIVSIAHVEHLLGVKAGAKVRQSREPNWDAVNAKLP